MHERSLAQDLVTAAGIAGLEAGGQVSSVRIQVGSQSCIDPDSLHDQLVWWSQGTIVEGARVLVEVIPADIDDPHGADVKLVSVDVSA